MPFRQWVVRSWPKFWVGGFVKLHHQLDFEPSEIFSKSKYFRVQAIRRFQGTPDLKRRYWYCLLDSGQQREWIWQGLLEKA
jgi:hypothetical protein